MLTKLFKRANLLSLRRSFCTSEYETSEELKTRILKTALIHVNKSGWNDQALAEACIDLGYPAVTSRVVPNGAIDLVYYQVDKWNDRLLEDLSNLDLENMRISDRIVQGIKIRLSYHIPYINRWNEALALGGLPANAPYTFEKIGRIADDIWYVAGDRSADYNWYSKRGLLMSAYFTTEMFMLTDKSENFVETWKFLDRRIADILKYGKYINTARNYGSSLQIALGSLVSMFHVYPDRFENDINEMKHQQGNFYNPDQTNTYNYQQQDNVYNAQEQRNMYHNEQQERAFNNQEPPVPLGEEVVEADASLKPLPTVEEIKEASAETVEEEHKENEPKRSYKKKSKTGKELEEEAAALAKSAIKDAKKETKGKDTSKGEFPDPVGKI